MPGFFDIIFRAPKPEPKATKPKKAKKAKKAKKTEKPQNINDDSSFDSIRADIADLKNSIMGGKESLRGDPADRKRSKTEPEPEIVTEEPEDDESS